VLGGALIEAKNPKDCVVVAMIGVGIGVGAGVGAGVDTSSESLELLDLELLDCRTRGRRERSIMRLSARFAGYANISGFALRSTFDRERLRFTSPVRPWAFFFSSEAMAELLLSALVDVDIKQIEATTANRMEYAENCIVADVRILLLLLLLLLLNNS